MEQEVIAEDKMETMVIDLGVNRRGEVNEQTLMQMGAMIKWMLDGMFRGAPVNAMLKGTRSEIQSFGNALKREKRYMNAYLKYGLQDARTLRNRSSLQSAVKNFERETGLIWPFK